MLKLYYKLDRHKVKFVDEDGTTVLKVEKEYPYGTKASDIEKPRRLIKDDRQQIQLHLCRLGSGSFKAKIDVED